MLFHKALSLNVIALLEESNKNISLSKKHHNIGCIIATRPSRCRTYTYQRSKYIAYLYSNDAYDSLYSNTDTYTWSLWYLIISKQKISIFVRKETTDLFQKHIAFNQLTISSVPCQKILQMMPMEPNIFINICYVLRIYIISSKNNKYNSYCGSKLRRLSLEPFVCQTTYR